MAAEGRLRDGQPPEWWEWDLELSSHLLKRMVDRDFNEPDLRAMLETAAGSIQLSWKAVGEFRRRTMSSLGKSSWSPILLLRLWS